MHTSETQNKSLLERASLYKEKISAIEIENDQLRTNSEKDIKIIKLESERKAIMALLGKDKDIIYSLLELLQQINYLQEENNNLMDKNQSNKEEVISMTKELEKSLEIHHLQLRTKEMTIRELEGKTGVERLKRQVQDLEERYKRTEIELSTEVSELLEQATKRDHLLKNALIDNIKTLRREAAAVIELEDEKAKNTNLASEYQELLNNVKQLTKYKELGIKAETFLNRANQSENEHRQIKEEYQALSINQRLMAEEHNKLKANFEVLLQEKEQLETKIKTVNKRYSALKNSKLGQITIKYWELSRKWGKGRQD